MADRRNRTRWYCGPKLNITRDELLKFEKTGKYVIDEKHDGNWGLFKVQNGAIVSAESRVGLEFIGADFDGLAGLKVFPESVNATLTGELVPDWVGEQQNGTRRIFLFDALIVGQEDLRNSPLKLRRQALEKLYSEKADTDLVHLVRQQDAQFQEFFDEILSRNGEGVVVKHKLSFYQPKNADGKIEEWLRCKPKRTIDYVVTGHGLAEKGTPNLMLALYKKTKDGVRPVNVMKTTIPKDLLHIAPQDFIGRVVELEGWEIFPSGALRFAEIQRVRDDKFPEDCSYESAMRAQKVA